MNIKSIIQDYRDKGYFRYILYAFIILIIIFFLVRNSIVQSVFERKSSAIEDRFGITINAGKIGFSGLRTIYVEKLSITPENRDTLFFIDRAEVKLSLTNLIFLKVNPLEIWLKSPKISFVGELDSSNYIFLIKPKRESINSKKEIVSENQTNYRLNTAYKLIKAMFGLTTATYHVTDFNISYQDQSYSTIISVPEFESNSKGLNTKIDIDEDGKKYSIILNGKTDKENNSIHFKAFRVGSKNPLPLIFHKFGVNLAFDTAEFKITADQLSSNDIGLEINSSVKSLEVFYETLSNQTVKINDGSFDFHISLNNDYYLIDSSSSVSLNGLNVKTFIKYEPSQNRYLSFKFETGEFPSQQLFESLPDGLFSNLKGIKTNGSIDYSLKFGVSLTDPDSVILEPILKTKDFSLIQFGNRDFAALNDTFNHEVYREGEYIRTIRIDSLNKDFRKLSQISSFIADAVITAEDGGFYNNSGVDIEGLRYAVKENIKQKRFARGGSTITMQLIKNLYLNQNKNLFRKVEEYIIVWLIESLKIVLKERLLEIYLNIIEWGPDVYGVTQACEFYFKKDPANVTLDEALYLASVIPRPSKFKYFFEKDGNLKSFIEQDFTFISNKMFQRGMISEDQLNQLIFNVTLTGWAKEMLVDTLSFDLDSLNIDEISLERDTTLLLH
ncbi:MAG: transglycosylase domain-containing protein [Tenuifilaceae bacterium]